MNSPVWSSGAHLPTLNSHHTPLAHCAPPLWLFKGFYPLCQGVHACSSLSLSESFFFKLALSIFHVFAEMSFCREYLLAPK